MIDARAGKLAVGRIRSLAIAAWAASGMLSAWLLFAAELSLPAPSWLEPPSAAALDVASPVSDDFRRRIEAASATIPDNVWRTLWEAGWRVQMAEFVVDAAPSLVGERPRGWPTGLTWEHTDAVNMPQRRLVVVAERRRNLKGEIVSSSRIEGVLRHEVGHAYDRIAGGRYGFDSSHPQFLKAYHRDLQTIAGADREVLAYYLQGDAAGRQEAYAEAFALVLGGGSDPPKQMAFLRAFPRVTAHLEKTLTSGGGAEQTARR
ncbi:MAG: hypothetical protein KY475_08450 [Planctomycetes bacterium]|nr:hypothetical protein [Planctomycetota bacterium]